jgi:hypothetical protein
MAPRHTPAWQLLGAFAGGVLVGLLMVMISVC